MNNTAAEGLQRLHTANSRPFLNNRADLALAHMSKSMDTSRHFSPAMGPNQNKGSDEPTHFPSTQTSTDRRIVITTKPLSHHIAIVLPPGVSLPLWCNTEIRAHGTSLISELQVRSPIVDYHSPRRESCTKAPSGVIGLEAFVTRL
jgi:hypothetical protein